MGKYGLISDKFSSQYFKGNTATLLILIIFIFPNILQAQHDRFSLNTTCNVEKNNLEFGIWWQLKGPQVQMEIEHLGNIMDDAMERHEKAELALSSVEILYTESGLLTGEDEEQVARELLEHAGVGLSEEAFGLTGEAAGIVYDAYKGSKNPKEAAEFIISQSASIINDLVAIIELGSRVPRQNTLIAIKRVLNSYYSHCGNRQQITNDLSIDQTYNSNIPFLTWTVEQWAKKNQSISFLSFLGVNSDDRAYFYSTDRINNMIAELQNEVTDIASKMKNLSSADNPPKIASIIPKSFVGRPVSQSKTIRITGTGFNSDANLEFYDSSGDCNPCKRNPNVINETTLEYDIATGTEEGQWEVYVVEDGIRSNKGVFNVLEGASGDANTDITAPTAPIDLFLNIVRPTQATDFRLNWQNPEDKSDISAVWYKIGSAPSSAEDGIRLDLPDGKPFSIEVENKGNTPVYVWLEDGEGNKDHTNRAVANIERDNVLPEVIIQEPIKNPSNDNVYNTTDGVLDLSGTMSDSQSEIVSVFWINSRGGTGFGSFSGSNWELENIPLKNGANAIGALAMDAAGNIGYDILGVQYEGNTTQDTVIVDSDIESNQTWSASDGIYYIDNDITIAEGATLTIEPGVEVWLPQDHNPLYVEGTLKAEGTAQDSIRFHPGPQGDPYGGNLRFRSTSTASVLDHVVIDGLTGDSNDGAVTIDGTSGVQLTNSRITGSRTSGLYLEREAQPKVEDNIFSGNGGPDIDITTANSLAEVGANRVGLISIRGDISTQIIWRLNGSDSTDYVLSNDITIAEGATLTIEPGVEVWLPQDHNPLYVEGTLKAEGTAQDSIRFHPGPQGDPYGGNLRFRSTSTASVLDHVVIDGLTGDSNDGAVTIDGTSGVQLTNSRITGSRTSGLYLEDGSSPKIRRSVFADNNIGIILSHESNPNLGISSDYGQNIFQDNIEFSIQNFTSNNINAIGNYWYSTDASVIDGHIYDDNEDSDSGPVIFEPFLDDTPGDGGSNITQPEIPTGLTATTSNGNIELTWNANTETNLAGYIIYRATFPFSSILSATRISGSDPVSENIFVDNNIETGRTYYYRITAIDIDGNESSLSPWISYVNEALNVSNEWKLISNPTLQEMNLSDVQAFRFDRTYQRDSVLTAGNGYWIKSNTDKDLAFQDQGIDNIDIELDQGWNMVGSLVDTIHTADIDDPGAVIGSAPVYSYNINSGNYQEATQLFPKKGYWLYAEESGNIQLSFHSDEQNQKEKPSQITGNEIVFDKIVFEHANSKQQLLYSNKPLNEQRYLLPPVPPQPNLDVRTSGGLKATGADKTSLAISSSTYPVQVSLEKHQDNNVVYQLSAHEGEDKVLLTLTSKNSLQIKESYEQISINRISESEVPLENKLLPNYPNPFNPTTTIKYEVASTSNVEIKVYDVLGREVRTLVNQQRQPGVYTTNFNGGDLASGLYFIKINAGQYAKVQKMTLIK